MAWIVFRLRFWKNTFRTIMYFVVSTLALHDLVVIVGKSIVPEIFGCAEPYLLEKILTIVLASFAL